MAEAGTLLAQVYDGWDGYQISLVKALAPLSEEQLAWRPVPGVHCAGEIAAHISIGRADWFSRMGAPGAVELAQEFAAVRGWNGQLSETAAGSAKDAAALVARLEASWKMVARTLSEWTVDDLATTYLHPYQGKTYAISRQWTIWRILSHDIHHGGQIALLLEAQGITPLELSALGGHLTEPAVVQDTRPGLGL